MKLRPIICFGSILCASGLALAPTQAYAAIACANNVCWHVHQAYKYPAISQVVVHDDTWQAGPKVVFREHDGRGYWRDQRWIVFGTAY